eukprot:4734780-Amphidinium_carterae.1
MPSPNHISSLLVVTHTHTHAHTLHNYWQCCLANIVAFCVFGFTLLLSLALHVAIQYIGSIFGANKE